jgi:hypothetical protein
LLSHGHISECGFGDVLTGIGPKAHACKCKDGLQKRP